MTSIGMTSIETNVIYNEDCLIGMQRIPDKSIDLVHMDPPYEIDTKGAGAFGSNNRSYFSELDPVSKGISDDILYELLRILKRPNIQIWCSQKQRRQFADFALNNGLQHTEVYWHKTDPNPLCNGHYLIDTEFVQCMKSGVKIEGNYHSLFTFYVQGVNYHEKERWGGHPTIKPLNIVRNLIFNAAKPGMVVLDPYAGTGTSAIACMELGMKYIGFEIEEKYWNVCNERIAWTKDRIERSASQRSITDFAEVRE